MKTLCILIEKGYNETCSDGKQCIDLTPGNVDCIYRVCECKSDNHFFGTQCWQDTSKLNKLIIYFLLIKMSIVCTELGQECSNEGECILRNNNVDDVQCTDGICQCVDGLRPSVENNQCNSGLLNAVYQEYFRCGLFYRRDQHCRCHLHGYCHCCRYTVLRNKMSNMHTLLIK
jgi:hypothetical protein